jgi:hypothetical protein
MGNLIWNGWAMTWEDVRRANNRTAILMGGHILKNTRPLHSDNRTAGQKPQQNRADDEVSTSTPETTQHSDAPDTRHFEISFPIAPTSSEKHKQSNE